jgi:ABC-type uncharacterized transport system fused permease/ATPase subunit
MDSGITFISIGHRPSLKPFHRQLLTINPTTTFPGSGKAATAEGAWELKSSVPKVYRMM